MGGVLLIPRFTPKLTHGSGRSVPEPSVARERKWRVRAGGEGDSPRVCETVGFET